jgi:DNA (cytosine-5)-methyltransferase 1
MSSFTFVDLFAGIGGFRCALTSLGGEHLFANEWDKDSATTYRKWYGDHNVSTEDFRNINPTSVPKHDVLAAGFPCQPFSIAGVSKKNSLGKPHGFEDKEQGNLFEFLAKFMSKNRPSVFILENVKNLLSHDKGNTFKEISRTLDDLGYSWSYSILSAETFVPQKRQRIFLVGFDKEVFGEKAIEHFSFPVYRGKAKTLNKILEKNPDTKYMLSDKLWAFLQAYKAKHAALGHGFGFKTFSAGDTARTMSARYYKDGADILINQPTWKNPRKLTPKEALKLMGFTSSYSALFGFKRGFPQVVSDAKTYKQCGNAVVPQVVESVMIEVLETVSKLGGFPKSRS